MTIRSYQELEVWKIAIEIAVEVYRLTNTGNFHRDYGLTDQLRRAAVSISSNIVEGFERNNNNEFYRFLLVAKGSLGELKSQLLISNKIGYLIEKDYQQILEKLDKLGFQVGSLLVYLKNCKKNGQFLNK